MVSREDVKKRAAFAAALTNRNYFFVVAGFFLPLP
jgi:hypothetical protein